MRKRLRLLQSSLTQCGAGTEVFEHPSPGQSRASNESLGDFSLKRLPSLPRFLSGDAKLLLFRFKIWRLPLSSGSKPTEPTQNLGPGGPWSAPEPSERLRVMRDMLSQQGRSERTHGRYLLRFSNQGRARQVRFLDQLPFFIRPLWHSLRAVWVTKSGTEELHGAEVLRRLQLRPPDVRFTIIEIIESH